MSATLPLTVFPSIKTRLEPTATNSYRLEIEPLIPGFGHTFGNSIRRILLSSIPGFGVTAVRINDLTHEFQPVKGVKEDAIDIVLNLKLIRAKILTNDQKATLVLKVTKSGKVYAKDFKKEAKVEISNPDQYICELDGSADLEIEIDIERGIGYRNADEMETIESPNPLDILVDTLFSPVTNVSLVIEKTRVGDKTNFDKIVLDFTTDGAVEVNDIVKYAFELLIDVYQKINSSLGVFLETGYSLPVTENKVVSDTTAVSASSSLSLSETDLSKRLIQILKKNDVNSVGDLQKFYTDGKTSDLYEFVGISEKYVTELKAFANSNSWE
jgi:DNA-directed RNA polymerase subunit alpha